MAEVSLSPALVARPQEDAVTGLDLYPSRSSAAYVPEPNPPFVFPRVALGPSMSDTEATLSSGASASMSVQAATRHRPERIDIDPVPIFSFPAPGTPPIPDSSQSSPTRPIPASRSGASHRRGGSEFIGGDGSSLGPGLMSSSPTKGENALPPPSMSGRRRGHAHRRSGAISNHDLSSILNPSENSSRKTGSAPATPSESDFHKQLVPQLNQSGSQPALHHSRLDNESPPKFSEPSPPPAQARPRVGFSDKLEYIPRPLSTISSATSSSISTIRPSHSLTGSISSVRSNNTPSPPSAERIRSENVFGGNLYPAALDSPPNGSEDSSSFRISIKTPYRYSPPPPASLDFDEEPSDLPTADEGSFVARPSPSINALSDPFTVTMKDVPANSMSQLQVDLRHSRGIADPPSDGTSSRSPPAAKATKRQKKSKSWTDLLSRKSKSPESASIATGSISSTGEVREIPKTQERSEDNLGSATSEEFSLEDVNFDEDTTFVLRSPQYDVPRSAPPNSNPTWHLEADVEPKSAPVFDLDAAWDLAGSEIESRTGAGGSGFQAGKRRMHSSGTTGAFVGPGMHYHRRAESAPVMAPVDYQLGFPRFGSNPQMADVFEEEEDEENPKAQTQNKIPQPESPGVDEKFPAHSCGAVGVEPSASSSSSEFSGHDERHEDPAAQENQSSATSGAPSEAITHDLLTASPDLSVEIVDAVDEPRFSVVTKSSDESTITPTLSNDALRSRPIPTSLDFAPARSGQLSGYSSMNPSPSPAKTSFDVPRLGTAHSSTTERSGWSSARTGEGSTDVGYSTEDVPSLTSSASTMISHAVPFTPVVGTRPDAERSQSLSEAVPERPTTAASTSKRRSLASLSMLRLGSSSGRSKLSIETRPDQDGEEGGERGKKKKHRLSRIMKFFSKSKEDIKA